MENDWFEEYGYGDWFSPKNYPFSRDHVYWADNIHERLLLSDILSSEMPLDLKKLLFCASLDGSSDFPAFPNYKQPYASLSEVDYLLADTLVDLLGGSKNFQDHKQSYLEHSDKFDLATTGGDEYLDRHEIEHRLSSRPLSDFELDSTNEVFFVADLDQDDDILIEQFRSLLKTKRKAPKNRIAEIDYQRWLDAGVLPCFDICVWADLVGHKITNSQIGDLIWPNSDFDRAEKVRKTSKRHLNDVISLRMLKRVGSQIQNNESGK